MKLLSDWPFSILLIAVVLLAAFEIARVSLAMPVTCTQVSLPQPSGQTAQMQSWLGDALPSSKLRLHRE